MNPVECTVFANLFASLCEQMGASLARLAFSPNIKDRRDYSCALFDRDGHLVGQACHIPVHLGAMAFAVVEVVREFPIGPGEILVLNSPFRGGTHLPDITFIAPVYFDGTLLGYVANRAHHADIGGAEPGSMPLSTSIDEEGMLIDPTLLDERLLRSICSAVRTPAERLGDLSAQEAAVRTGRAGLKELAAGYGCDKLFEAFDVLQDRAGQYMRAALSTVPDGTYSFTDYLDGDGIEDGRLPIAVSITIKGSFAVIDFTGTSPACTGNLNCPRGVTWSSVLYVFRCLVDEDCPSNYGLLGPLEVLIPNGCLLDARSPSAVAAGNVETSQRVVDALLGALSLAVPGRIPSASCGSMNNIAIGGRDDDGQAFAYYETIAGGAGAHPSCDGASAVHTHMTNTLNTPVESLEHHYPLRVVRYELRRGSGGCGLRRGGDGVIREIEALVPCRVSILSERRGDGPYGLNGGAAGQAGVNELVDRSGRVRVLPGKTVFNLAPKERVIIKTPGGGGWGEPVSD